MTTTETSQTIESIRKFNRFYTRHIGLLNESLLQSPFSLTEARVLYELAHHEATTATQLGQELGLDAGYLSRILRGFGKQGLIARTPSETDGRQVILSLSDAGQESFAALNDRSRDQIAAMLAALSAEDQANLIRAMDTIAGLLGAREEKKVSYILRPHRPGDMGWVIHRHGVLYSQEYNWDETFEALVAEIAAKFIQHFDPKRERCWIAEKDGEIVGSVFLVKGPDSAEGLPVAKLRLLLVEPKARGLGIGARLVDECICFARSCGYSKITLWTNSVLLAARHIYEKAGFELVDTEQHHSFGHDLVGETWDLIL